MSLLSLLTASRNPAPVRRVLAVDAGSRSLKLLLAENDAGRVKVLKQEFVDLKAEGLVSPEETKAQLQAMIQDWGQPPVALVLPQHISISQVIDVPVEAGSDIHALIQADTARLSGASDSRIVFDFAPVDSGAGGAGRHEFWVTLAQEAEILDRIAGLGLEEAELCEATTTANALISAYHTAAPDSARAILVYLGAQSTVLVVLANGAGAFAASFHMGGDFFSRAIARDQGCDAQESEDLKHGQDLFAREGFGGLRESVEGWAAELKRQLNDWFEHNPAAAAEAGSFKLVAAGGGFDQPGLLARLRDHASLDFHRWPATSPPGAPGFEAAYGAAAQALGFLRPGSLLPEASRANWNRSQAHRRLEFASAVVLTAASAALLLGSWRQASLGAEKETLLGKVRSAQQMLATNAVLGAELAGQYENLRPLLAAERNTADTLATLGQLGASRSNRSYYYVLAADQQSYFTLPAPTGTNRTARISPPPEAALIERLRAIPPDTFVGPLPPATPPPAKPGLIAELCVPEDSETARRTLVGLVNDLKSDPRLSKVDLLSDDLHRPLADPKLLIPDRHFVLALDFAATEFAEALPARPPSPPPDRGGPKRGVRPDRRDPAGGGLP